MIYVVNFFIESSSSIGLTFFPILKFLQIQKLCTTILYQSEMQFTFTKAESDMNYLYLMSVYQQYQDATADDDGEFYEKQEGEG